MVIAAFLTDYAEERQGAPTTDIDGTAALCEEVGVVAKSCYRQEGPAQRATSFTATVRR
ncbi:MAG: hypothetical protein ACLVJH_12150 [Faecalibacterium prausnitzii]